MWFIAFDDYMFSLRVSQHVECLLCAHDEEGERIAREYENRFRSSAMNSIILQADGGISILDESLGIDWRIPTDKAILSEKDTKHPLLKDFDSPFDIKVDIY